MRDEFEHAELSEFLTWLINGGYLEGAAEGVAKRVISHGEESLSEKQAFVFKKYVLDEHAIYSCSRCSVELPWSEMPQAMENGGMCNYCENAWIRMQNE